MKTGIRKMLCACCAAAMLAGMGAGCARAEGAWQQTVKYGKVVEETWTEADGTVSAGPEGYARVTYDYEKSDTTERYWDAEGNPYRMAGGYYGRTVTRDGKRQITGITYLDAEGKRALTDWGYARVRTDWTSFGEIKFVMYYGMEKSPVTVPALGYAGIRTEFRGKTMTRRTYLDPQENPTDSAEGYAVVVQRINKKNQVLGIQYEHADGSPATGRDGWSRREKTLDKKGREISTKYYTADGTLMDRGAGYAWEETEYSGNNETLTTRYDLAGEKIETTGGYTTLRREWSEDLVVRESYLNAAGERILNRDGIGAVHYSYDSEGRVVRVQYEDLKGKPMARMEEGYAGYQDTLDENGVLVKREYLDVNGRKANRAEGYAEVRYSYDAAWRLVGEQKYDVNGLPVTE